MSTPRWPGSLPEWVLSGSYGEQPVMPRASFDADVGPPIERPKGTYRMTEIACSTIMYDEQLRVFEDFVLRDLAQGTKPFYRNHPRRNEQVLLKLKGENGHPYSVRPSGLEWEVSFTLLVLGA